MQLGHEHGQKCSKPLAAPKSFTVMHVNGMHNVAVDYCGCNEEAGSQREQLLRRQWYPATSTNPRTCASMRLLEHFHLTQLETKGSTYHYYRGIEHLTDNTGGRKVQVCLHDRVAFRSADGVVRAYRIDTRHS